VRHFVNINVDENTVEKVMTARIALIDEGTGRQELLVSKARRRRAVVH
jgi:hypothetical protein